MIAYQGILAGLAGRNLSLGTAPVSTITQAGATATLSLNTIGGTFRLGVGGILTYMLPFDITAANLQSALRALLGNSGAIVSQIGQVYTISGLTAALSIDNRHLITPAVVSSRTSGINYYEIDKLNIDTGTGDDIFNIRGTSALTNVFLHEGNDRIYISSIADENLVTAPITDFLQGNLDQIRGTLNVDAGTGRHLLMVSDEAALAGDGSATSRAVITDQPVPGVAALPISEITIAGLSPAPITYGAAAAGNFADGITVWTGWGNDFIKVDGTHDRPGVRTVTTLNTGLGDDNVLVDLDAGDDGFFVLNSQGPYNSYQNSSDKDFIDASASTLPLVIFGGQGRDNITGGSADDVIFGDRGRVYYYDAGGLVVATLGNGGPGDRTEGSFVPPRRSSQSTPPLERMIGLPAVPAGIPFSVAATTTFPVIRTGNRSLVTPTTI